MKKSYCNFMRLMEAMLLQINLNKKRNKLAAIKYLLVFLINAHKKLLLKLIVNCVCLLEFID